MTSSPVAASPQAREGRRFAVAAFLLSLLALACFGAAWWWYQSQPQRDAAARVTKAQAHIRANAAPTDQLAFRNVTDRRGGVCGQVAASDGKGGSTGFLWFYVPDGSPHLYLLDRLARPAAAEGLCASLPARG
jgi:hypothetical protein